MLFVAWFVPTTALDLATTWFGIFYLPDRVEKFGIVETNPFTDMSSMGAFVIPEVVALGIGTAMVFGGGMLKMRQLAALGQRPEDLRRLGTRAFAKQYEKLGRLATVLTVVPLVVAIIRIEPVIGNVLWLSIGWGPNAILGRYLTIILTCLLAYYPAHYMIRRWTL